MKFVEFQSLRGKMQKRGIYLYAEGGNDLRNLNQNNRGLRDS